MKESAQQPLVIASGNRGKLVEFSRLLPAYQCIPQHRLGLEPAEEVGSSFEENALIKARTACAASGMPTLADDSGLEVDALGGDPGLYSARFAGPNADAAANRALLLEHLADVPEAQRTAKFHCCIVVLRDPEAAPMIVSTRWEGSILTEPRGSGGFGYDPLFLVPELNCSAAELEGEQKDALSHRGQALRILVADLGGYLRGGSGYESQSPHRPSDLFR